MKKPKYLLYIADQRPAEHRTGNFWSRPSTMSKILVTDRLVDLLHFFNMRLKRRAQTRQIHPSWLPCISKASPDHHPLSLEASRFRSRSEAFEKNPGYS